MFRQTFGGQFAPTGLSPRIAHFRVVTDLSNYLT